MASCPGRTVSRCPAGRHRVPTWQDCERPGAAETWTRARVTWRSTTPSPTCLAFRLPHGSSQASHGGRQTRTRLNNARSDFRLQSSSSMWLLVYSLVHTAATTTTTYLPNYTVYMYTMPTNYLRVSSLYPAFSLIFSFSVNIYINCAKCYQLPCAVLCYVQFQIRKRSAWFVLHLCKFFPFFLSSLPVPNAPEIRSDVVSSVALLSVRIQKYSLWKWKRVLVLWLISCASVFSSLASVGAPQ